MWREREVAVPLDLICQEGGYTPTIRDGDYEEAHITSTVGGDLEGEHGCPEQGGQTVREAGV